MFYNMNVTVEYEHRPENTTVIFFHNESLDFIGCIVGTIKMQLEPC